MAAARQGFVIARVFGGRDSEWMGTAIGGGPQIREPSVRPTHALSATLQHTHTHTHTDTHSSKSAPTIKEE